MNTVRYCRLRGGLTQRQLAERAGVSQSAIGRIEADRVNPRIGTVARLLRECEMSLEPLPRSGAGIDRLAIRRMLALTPRERLALAAKEARNLDRMLHRTATPEQPDTAVHNKDVTVAEAQTIAPRA